MSQTVWFKRAIEIYYQMTQASPAQLDGLRTTYEALVTLVADTGKIPREQIKKAITARIRVYRHSRLEGFTEEEAFQQATENGR